MKTAHVTGKLLTAKWARDKSGRLHVELSLEIHQGGEALTRQLQEPGPIYIRVSDAPVLDP